MRLKLHFDDKASINTPDKKWMPAKQANDTAIEFKYAIGLKAVVKLDNVRVSEPGFFGSAHCYPVR